MRPSVRKLLASGLATAALSASAVTVAPGLAGAAAKAKPTVATWAEAPQTPPNYIFPFMPLQYFSVSTISNFQMLMFRPLYWFGQGKTPNLNASLSLASSPTYSNGNKTVTVNLKNYQWSNNEKVTAQDVMFWMNMLHADKDQWADYSAGTGIPDDVASITVNSPTKITFQLKSSVNTHWFTYNELSQITPMPLAWDKTSDGAAAGSGGCAKAAYGTADAKCNAVFEYLSKASGFDPSNPKGANNSLSTYATNPLWQVVDGPWRLSKFDASGNVEFVPNPKYSGPIKPSVKKFIEVPFTTDTAEFAALVGGKVDVGYLPSADITSPTKNPFVAGANNPRLTAYTLDPIYSWSINYFPYNFQSTGNNGNAGKIFSQLYFRQAFQSLVNQTAYIQKIWKNYGIPTYGPVPTYPPNPYASSFEKSNPYPYSVSKAKALLAGHGWKVIPNGTSTCIRPGSGSTQCGKGIPAGAKLDFSLEYATGGTALAQLMNVEKSSWAQAGINITLRGASFNTVLGHAIPCTAGQSCDWELANWGGGWVFSPDYYPSGEAIFQTGAGSNSGSYSSAPADRLIAATTSGNVSLTSYENFLAKDLPVVYQPDPATSLTEIRKGLKGVTPQSPLFSITPENWRF